MWSVIIRFLLAVLETIPGYEILCIVTCEERKKNFVDVLPENMSLIQFVQFESKTSYD